MVTIYHLKTSRSTRIIWLAEELGLDYTIEVFEREEEYAAPPAFKALHPLARAPMIRDGTVTLPESGAIIEYLITRYGDGRLRPGPESTDYPDYLYWLHFAEASAMMFLGTLRVLATIGAAESSHPMVERLEGHASEFLAYGDEVLGQRPYFAGDELTGADINMALPLNFAKAMLSEDFRNRSHLAAYLERIEERPAYRKAASAG